MRIFIARGQISALFPFLFAYSAREMGTVGRVPLALFGLGALLIGRDYLAVRKEAPGAAA